ncbi:MAG: AbrB/MazE/SpoVT family DNA-binding domain-containing protein [Nanoarchaeota archaeon]|nr:AbrB/MazE/SpoVT family DNA-binding domain-containing protein [Nanoarchaeota archaeon]
MDIAITKMSSKGQIVIPAEMRKDIKEGEKLILIKSNGRFTMKKATEMDKQLEEDMEFSRRTEEAWKRYDKGEFKKMSSDDFLKELEKW